MLELLGRILSTTVRYYCLTTVLWDCLLCVSFGYVSSTHYSQIFWTNVTLVNALFVGANTVYEVSVLLHGMTCLISTNMLTQINTLLSLLFLQPTVGDWHTLECLTHWSQHQLWHCNQYFRCFVYHEVDIFQVILALYLANGGQAWPTPRSTLEKFGWRYCIRRCDLQFNLRFRIER